MPIYVQWAGSKALEARLKAVQDAARPGSRAVSSYRGDLARIVREDHEDKMLRGVDRYGRPRAELAPSTLADGRRGPGPSLIPRGRASRFITHFETAWQTSAGGVMLLVGRFRDILSKRGRPFAQHHLEGCLPGSNPARPNWSLPRRDVGGITPKGWRRVVERHRRFADDVRKYGGGR